MQGESSISPEVIKILLIAPWRGQKQGALQQCKLYRILADNQFLLGKMLVCSKAGIYAFTTGFLKVCPGEKQQRGSNLNWEQDRGIAHDIFDHHL